MQRRTLLRSILGLGVLGAAGGGWLFASRRVRPLAIDPEGRELVYRDGWIELANR